MAKTKEALTGPENGSADLPPAVVNGNGNLAAALVAAQQSLPKVEPNATNPHFKSKFVTLDHLLAKVRPVLNAHGLAVVQFPSIGPAGEPALTTTLLHVSGERLSEQMLLQAVKPDPQAQGSALTYARRYALAAVLGISSETDDDANAGTRTAAPDEPDLSITWETLDPGAVLHPDAPKGWKEIDTVLAALDPTLDRKAFVQVIFQTAYSVGSVADLGDRAQEAGRRLANLAGYLADVTMQGREFPPPSLDEYRQAVVWAFGGGMKLDAIPVFTAEEDIEFGEPLEGQEPS